MMSHPAFKNIGTMEDKIVEELSELIQAICKAKRFGYFEGNPFVRPFKSNYMRINEEMQDVSDRLAEYKEYMYKLFKEKE